MPFNFSKLEIPDVFLIDALTFPDERGFFKELYKESIFLENGIHLKFVQDNFSHSTKGVLRGLHYQKNPMAQAKLVTVITGKIFDVAVDLRQNSPTYGKWVSEILSSQNHKMLYIPKGFAHGFYVLSETADVHYKVDQEYSPEHECSIIWNDPVINIKWPVSAPNIIKKDLANPLLKDADNNFIKS